MSNTAITYLIAAVVGVTSLSLWSWLILVPAVTAYTRWWERVVAAVMSVYVLVAMLAAGGLVGAIFLWYYDRIG
jgi:O-antigen ligase